ncbi:MAG: arsenate reductase ArsC [Bacteroidia bacterium]
MKVRLLFVCVENSNRSQMAQAFAIMHGKDKVEAMSAGSKPSGKINPKAVSAMQELGYDLSKHQSKSLNEIPYKLFDYVVTMGCGDECPYVLAKNRVDWQIPDPRNMNENDFREIRNMIEGKVKELLSRIYFST